MPKKILGEKFYTSEEIGEMLDVSTSSVAKYLREGRMKGVKLAGNWYASETDIKDFLHGGAQDYYEEESE